MGLEIFRFYLVRGEFLPLACELPNCPRYFPAQKLSLAGFGLWQISLAFGLQILGFLSVEKCNVNP